MSKRWKFLKSLSSPSFFRFCIFAVLVLFFGTEKFLRLMKVRFPLHCLSHRYPVSQHHLFCFAINFIYLFIYLFIYFWLRWVFIAARRRLPSCGERGLLFVAVHGLLLLWSTGSRHVARQLSSCGSRALERRLSSCGARA